LCARIAIETKQGLGAVLRRKFPTWLVGLAVFGLLAANTINMGADLGAIAAGIQLLIGDHIPGALLAVTAGALIVVVQLFSTYERVVRVFKVLTLALFAY